MTSKSSVQPSPRPAFAHAPTVRPAPATQSAAASTSASTDQTFIGSIRYTLSRYGVVAGRASRSEFWYFTVFYMLVYIFATMLDVVASFLLVETDSLRSFVWFGIIAWASLFLPSLSVFARRAHDMGHSAGWYMPIFLATQIGSLLIVIGNMRVVWLIVLLWIAGIFVSYLLFVRRGSSGPNRFGEQPPTFA
jgi:uncharacterized membrane protein YhaH (DUF805 family)